MKKIIYFLVFTGLLGGQVTAQISKPTFQQYRKIVSKLLFENAEAPLTNIELKLTKDPSMAFYARIHQIETPNIWHFFDIEGSLKTNNGYAPLFGGGEVNANPKAGLSYNIMPFLSTRATKNRQGNTITRSHFLWINPKFNYEYSEYTTIQNYSADTISFDTQIGSIELHRLEASLSINYLWTLGNDQISDKHTFYFSNRFKIKFEDNNAAVLPDIKATTYKTYYDSTAQLYRTVENKDVICGKGGKIDTFTSFSIKADFTYIYKANKNNYIALNINSLPQFNLSSGNATVPVGVGLYFPIHLPKEEQDIPKQDEDCCCPQKLDNNQTPIVNLGFVFNLDNVLTGTDQRPLKDRIDFGIAINVPLSKLAPNQ